MPETELLKKIKAECCRNRQKPDYQNFRKYKEIIDSFSGGYFIKPAGCSINETPMLSLKAEGADAPQAYIWIFGDYFYLKTPFEITSTESLVKLHKLTDSYFYC